MLTAIACFAGAVAIEQAHTRGYILKALKLVLPEAIWNPAPELEEDDDEE